MRVFTQTMTGSPNVTSSMPTAYSSTPYGGMNTTVAGTGTGNASPTLQSYTPGASSGASHDAINLAVAAIVGGAALLVL